MRRRYGLSWKSSTPTLPPCPSRPSTRDGTTQSIAWAKTWRYGFRGEQRLLGSSSASKHGYRRSPRGCRCRYPCLFARACPAAVTLGGGASCRGSAAQRRTSRLPTRGRRNLSRCSCGRCTFRHPRTRRATPFAACLWRSARPSLRSACNACESPLHSSREVSSRHGTQLSTREPTWIHGDLHARNVLVENGAITGVIDWGDVAVGDRATDLAAVWMVFGDAQARDAAQRALDVSDTTWIRAKGWAVALGVMLLDSGLRDHPRHAAMGESTLRRITER